MAKIYRKITDKGIAIRFQIARGLTNAEISRTLGVCESLVRYYRQRPEKLERKRADKIYHSNKAIGKLFAGLIAIKINNELKKDDILDKKGRPVTFKRRQVYKLKKIIFNNKHNFKKHLLIFF
jgi:predicted transcriptional regulator